MSKLFSKILALVKIYHINLYLRVSDSISIDPLRILFLRGTSLSLQSLLQSSLQTNNALRGITGNTHQERLQMNETMEDSEPP